MFPIAHSQIHHLLTGGSILSVELDTPLPDASDTLYCKFDKIVVASHAYKASTASGGPTASCIVPSSRKERQKIELAVSTDNVTFEVFGSFVYYGECNRSLSVFKTKSRCGIARI